MNTTEAKYLNKGAQLSPCQKYRYTLWRVWDESRPQMAYVGLNPSTADANQDDPTIRRCVNFASAHGFGGMTMLNLWAFRSTDPQKLTGIVTDEERENEAVIARVASDVPRIVAAWGAHRMALRRAPAIKNLAVAWWCLGTTRSGQPRHPLYLPNGTEFVRYA